MNVTLIGAGKMGEALARGILRAGLLTPSELVLCDVDTERAASLAAELGATAIADSLEAARNAQLLVIAVKPKDLPALCQAIAVALPANAAVLSIAAGVTLERIGNYLGRPDLILARAMPNTPCLISAGAIGLSFSPGAPDESRRLILSLLSPLGLVEEMPESLLDAVTGLSGSGPAYVAIFIEALADGAVKMGLPRAQALRFAAQTVYGTARLMLETGQHPAQIKDAVSSPAGTTIAAIAALEAAGFRSAAISAVEAATLRSKELSGE